MLSHVFATCLMVAASSYQVPPAVLFGIYDVEGGKVGQAVGPNKNGTYDLGPMQINTLWVPVLAKHWDITEPQAKHLLKNDACTNANVAAWILRNHLDETKSLPRAIAHYHSRTPHIGYRYKKKVIEAMRRKGLIKSNAEPTATAQEKSVITTRTYANAAQTK
jgi:soluble lytic murein transglycosylase-like protein